MPNSRSLFLLHRLLERLNMREKSRPDLMAGPACGNSGSDSAVPVRRNEYRRPTQEAMMARDIAVAALVAFSAGVMSGVVVTTALAIRSKGRRNSVAGLSLNLLELKHESS